MYPPNRRNGDRRRSLQLAAALIAFLVFILLRQLNNLQPVCRVRPLFYSPSEYDARRILGDIPDHVHSFDDRGVTLPTYSSSEVLLVSVTSNNTYSRQVAQNFTFGRIIPIRFVTDTDVPNCILCREVDLNERCHCPVFRSPCRKHIFFERSLGWWCATRKALSAIDVVAKEWKERELPKWLFLLDDNTWVNPLSLFLMLQHLDPDEPYFIGDDYGEFLAGGPGQLMSRAALQRLLGPSTVTTVQYHWNNGSHAVVPESQLHSCIARMQGGDWCFFHGDWALAACLRELSQRCENGKQWFHVSANLASVLHETHSIALHVEPEEMFHIFYKRIVPAYQSILTAAGM